MQDLNNLAIGSPEEDFGLTCYDCKWACWSDRNDDGPVYCCIPQCKPVDPLEGRNCPGHSQKCRIPR